MSKKPKIDYAYISKEIQRMDPQVKPGNPAFLISVALLASGTTGPNADRLAKFMGCPRSDARKFGAMFRRAGLWTQTKIAHSGWFDEEGGGVAFWLDVACAQGLLKRVAGDAPKAPEKIP